jgi:hypothetical protein
VRRFLVPAAVGCVLFWAILRIAGRWLLFSARVPGAVYSAAIWALMLAASLAVGLLAARMSGLGWGRAAVAAAIATLELVAIVLAGAVLLARVAPGVPARLLYAEPSDVVLVVGLSAVLTALTLLIIRSGRPRPPA